MSYNTPKIINVFYKEDRKPYDENGKAISFFGEDFIGSNDATKIRFYLLPNQTLDGLTGIVHAKRADGEIRFELLTKSSSDLGNYFEVSLNSWFTMKTGKVTLSFKVYSGTVVFGETEGVITSIESITDAVVVASDIFSFNVGYAPNATEVVPPFVDGEFEQLLFALGQKPDFGETIYVVSELPTDLGPYDNQWFLVKNPSGGNIGKLYHINLPDAEEVELGVGSVRLTTEGNGEVTADSGKLYFDNPNGTATLGLFNDVNLQIGQELHYYGKASGDITNGDIVQFAGIQGDHYLVKKAVPSEINANPQLIMGMATQDIANNAFGYVTAFGKVNDFDSKGFAVGSFIWFASGGATNGAWTTTEPTAPNAKVLVGVIVKAETSTPANNGVALIRPTIQPRLEDLQNVNIASVATDDVLRYDGTKWINDNSLTVAEGEIDTLQTDVDNLETRMTTAENDIDQLETDVVDLDDRLDFIEVNGGIDFVKVADFASLPSSGDARDRRIYLTEDTNKLYTYDTEWLEVRQSSLTSDNGQANGFVTTDYGTRITHSGATEATVLQVIQNAEVAEGKIFEALNSDGVQFAVNKDGSVNAYGDLTIAGNLTVSGTTTTVNTATLDIEDNIITINKNQTGTPETTLLSGIEVERGDQTNFQFVFQESSDLFKVGQVGDLQAVATREDAPTDKGVAFFNTSTNKFETSSNLKVNTSGQLEDVTIRNSAVGVSPLIVNAITSTSNYLQQWQLNGANRGAVDNNGWYRSNGGVANLSGFGNANVNTSTTGTIVTRDVADANSALKVNLANASSSGNIVEFQNAGSLLSRVDASGAFRGTEFVNGSSFNNARITTSTTGTTVSRNIADGNHALIVNQINASSTGNIANFQFAGANKLEITKDGFLTQNGTRLFSQPLNNGTTFFGTNAGNLTLTGTNNTSFGGSTLTSITTGTGNSALGIGAGISITTGSNNSFLGRDSGNNASQLVNAQNSTAIGNGSFTDASNQMVFGNASVTEFKFDRNASANIKAPKVELLGAVGNKTLIDFTAPVTAGANNGGRIILRRSGNSEILSSINMLLDNLTNGTTNYISFNTNNDLSNTERMRITSAGNVGIGTSNPSQKLDVVDSVNGGYVSLRVFNSDSGSSATRSRLILETGLNIASIESASGVGGAGHLAFFNENAERMRIDSTGNVGIGTTTPDSRLHLQGPVDVAPVITLDLNDSGLSVNPNQLYGAINWKSNDAQGNGVRADIRVFGEGTSGESYMTFGTRVAGNTESPTSAIERMRITSTGNVGFGTNPVLASGTGMVVYNGADTTRLELRNSITGNLATDGMGLLASSNNYIVFNRENGFLRFDVNGSERMKIEPTGLVGINETSPTAQLQVKSGATNRVGLVVDTLASHLQNIQEWKYGGNLGAYVDNEGNFFNENGTYGTISDRRLKENIVDSRNYLDDVAKLRVVKYSLKEEKATEPTHLGFIAQEFEQVFPKMVGEFDKEVGKDDEGNAITEKYKSIKMSVLIPMLVKSIQELKAEIDELKKK